MVKEKFENQASQIAESETNQEASVNSKLEEIEKLSHELRNKEEKILESDLTQKCSVVNKREKELKSSNKQLLAQISALQTQSSALNQSFESLS